MVGFYLLYFPCYAAKDHRRDTFYYYKHLTYLKVNIFLLFFYNFLTSLLDFAYILKTVVGF